MTCKHCERRDEDEKFEVFLVRSMFKGLLQWQHLAATDPDALENEWNGVQS